MRGPHDDQCREAFPLRRRVRVVSIAVATGLVVADEARVATTLGVVTDIRLTRRCADLADLLAVASAGRAQVVVVSADLPGLDRSALDTIRATGAGIIGLFDPGDERQQRTLLQRGIRSLLPADAAAGEFAAAIRQEASGRAEAPSRADDDVEAEPITPMPPHGDTTGRIIAVWGPVGAPGRTTVAVNIAVELARIGVSAMLIDADTYGASVAQHLALLDEAPGLAAATRLAEAGRLDRHALASVAPEAVDGLRVLTGLPRADRWPEVAAGAFDEVLRRAAQLVAVTVVDVSAVLEDDEELSYDTLAPRRNAATTTALRAATHVLAVGSADPVGLQRLVRGLDELREITPTVPRVVVTKVRSSAVGSGPERRVSEALARFAGIGDPTLVPDDRAALDRTLLSGRLLAQEAPASPARRAIAALAVDLADVGEESRATHRRRRRRLIGRSA